MEVQRRFERGENDNGYRISDGNRSRLDLFDPRGERSPGDRDSHGSYRSHFAHQPGGFSRRLVRSAFWSYCGFDQRHLAGVSGFLSGNGI